MLTEVMRYYGLARPPIDAGFFETEHHGQVSRDIRAAILGGRMVALTAVRLWQDDPVAAAARRIGAGGSGDRVPRADGRESEDYSAAADLGTVLGSDAGQNGDNIEPE
jgi:hypothetical protein